MSFEIEPVATNAEAVSPVGDEQAEVVQTDVPDIIENKKVSKRLDQSQLRKLGGIAHSSSAVYPDVL